jgi:hypothetical protein
LFENARLVYGKYGIKLEFGSGQSLLLPDSEARRLAQVDGQCKWRIDSGEYRDVQQLGGPIPSTDILVFYVGRFSEANLLGCGGHIPGRPACIVAAQGGPWDTAHEVGHVLLGSFFSPSHSTDPSNLMYQYSSISPATPTLTTEQLAQIRKSPCCIPVGAIGQRTSD